MVLCWRCDAQDATCRCLQWCGPCQILAGELERVAGLYGDKLRCGLSFGEDVVLPWLRSEAWGGGAGC